MFKLVVCSYPWRFGRIQLVLVHEKLCYISLARDLPQPWLNRHFPGASLVHCAVPADLRQWLVGCLSGRDVPLPRPLFVRGTAFQQSVWQIVATIPCGQTRTYAQVAGAVGTRGYQAVGQAVGKNPLPLAIPCHRVTATNGLGGFSSGLQIKRYLLQLEAGSKSLL